MSLVLKILGFFFFLQIAVHPCCCDPNQIMSHDRYFVAVQNQKLTKIKCKTVRVHNRMACVHQCTRMADSCNSVNFKKPPTNGLHSCELMTSGMYDQPDVLQHDHEFDHIKLQLPYPKSCDAIYENGGRTNCVYTIYPIPSHPIKVYCDMVTSGGGWTVIQKRMDGSVDFHLGWADYKRGFGNKHGEYWLGLDNIHMMTSQRSYRLRVDIEDFDGNKGYAEYGIFSVADETDEYRLTVEQYSGTAGDSLSYHSGMQFSTNDHDNDIGKDNANCAEKRKGSWWYKSCTKCNPNGRYLDGGSQSYSGITWYTWMGDSRNLYSKKRIEVKIRPVD